jgi:hypothetical protein
LVISGNLGLRVLSLSSPRVCLTLLPPPDRTTRFDVAANTIAEIMLQIPLTGIGAR